MRNKKGQFVKGFGFWTGKKRSGMGKNLVEYTKKHGAWGKGKHIQTNTGRTHFKKGRVITKEQRIKMSETAKRIGNEPPHHKAEKHYNWKGGITPITKQIRRCFQYRQWKSDIFTRDNYTCVLCGKRGGELNADHYPRMFSVIFREYKIKSLEEALYCEEFWNINNGRTLCVSCHRKTFKNKNK